MVEIYAILPRHVCRES